MLKLRPVADSDLPVFFEHQREPEGSAMAAVPSRERDAFMTHWRTKVLCNPHGHARAIVIDEVVAGNIVSWDGEDKRLVGYWIGRAHWGRGIATTALADFLATTETTRPVYALVASRNLGSMRVLEKCGFRQDGDAATGHDGVEELLMRFG